MFEQTFAPALRTPVAPWRSLAAAALLQLSLASALVAQAILAPAEISPPVTLAIFTAPPLPPPPPPARTSHEARSNIPSRSLAPHSTEAPPVTSAALPADSGPSEPASSAPPAEGVEGGHSSTDCRLQVPLPPPPPRKVLQAFEVLPIRPLFQPAPAYPRAAAAMGLTGRVVVEIVVDETGAVREARVVHSTDRLFEEAALEAVRRWRYSRPVDARSGSAVSCLLTVTVHFRLR